MQYEHKPHKRLYRVLRSLELGAYTCILFPTNVWLNISDACPSPPNLPHGSHDGNDFSFGNSVSYICDKQYVLEGNAVITCVAGQWVGQVPVCRGKFKRVKYFPFADCSAHLACNNLS